LATGGGNVDYWTIDVKQLVDSTANAGQWQVKCFGDFVPRHAKLTSRFDARKDYRVLVAGCG
jgi:hypothetical protein